MTSLPPAVRALLAGAALSCAIPAAAQDIRDIPQKIDTRVTGPVQPKQGREVQGPPAPLETQLRDTPPDEPIVRQPQSQPQLQVPQQTPPQARPVPAQPARVRGSAAPAPAPRVQGPQPARPEAVAPARQAAPAADTAPGQDAAPMPLPDGAAPTGPLAVPPAATPPAATLDPGTPPVLDEGAETAAPSGASSGMLPWGLGGAGLLVLGGLAYAMTRRRRTAAPGARDYGGIALGQQPEADALGPVAAPAVRKPAGSMAAPQSTRPSAPPPPAAPVAAPPPPPVKAASDGRIVSRIRAPLDDGAAVSAAPPPARPQPAAPPPVPVKPASDGRIVSRLKVGDIAGEEAPPPPPHPPRRRAPVVKTVSVGYSVKGK